MRFSMVITYFPLESLILTFTMLQDYYVSIAVFMDDLHTFVPPVQTYIHRTRYAPYGELNHSCFLRIPNMCCMSYSKELLFCGSDSRVHIALLTLSILQITIFTSFSLCKYSHHTHHSKSLYPRVASELLIGSIK